jgi:hypothetical protein
VIHFFRNIFSTFRECVGKFQILFHFSLLENLKTGFISNLLLFAIFFGIKMLISDFHSSCKISRSLGTSASVVGGSLTIAGGVLTVTTGGLAAPLLVNNTFSLEGQR